MTDQARMDVKADPYDIETAREVIRDLRATAQHRADHHRVDSRDMPEWSKANALCRLIGDPEEN